MKQKYTLSIIISTVLLLTFVMIWNFNTLNLNNPILSNTISSTDNSDSLTGYALFKLFNTKKSNSATCSGPKILNHNVKDKITYYYNDRGQKVTQTLSDYCEPNQRDVVTEYYCDKNLRKQKSINCQKFVDFWHRDTQSSETRQYGLCQDGACKTLCIDSDGGSYENTYGETIGINNKGEAEKKTDTCIDQTRLTEYYCVNNDKYLHSTTKTCGIGKKCYLGECIRDTTNVNQASTEKCGYLAPDYITVDPNYRGSSECIYKVKSYAYRCSVYSNTGRFPFNMTGNSLCSCSTNCIVTVSAYR